MESAKFDLKNQKSFSEILGKLKSHFKKDLDKIWEARDVNNDGLLQKDETRLFLLQV